ncbi:MAG: ribonuclease R [Muribaculaceae bacterium]|nr:ribonuclease R [Muribaculaceae bacterium]
MAKGNNEHKRNALYNAVIEYFNTQTATPVNFKQVAGAIGAGSAKQRVFVGMTLKELARDGFLKEVTPGKYKAVKQNSNATGTFVRRSNGKNGVTLDSGDGEVLFVAEYNSMHALNGDKVRVQIGARRYGQEPEAKVIEILEKKEQVFIGTLNVDKYFSSLVPDTKFLACDIIIPRNMLKGGKDCDKAVVRILDWPADSSCPIGKVEEVLGTAGENNAEIHAILAEYGLPYRYPENVEKAAEKIPAEITEEEIAKRRDMRNVVTFTIDPITAKDFDDALSIERLPNGLWQVGIHIADVTHYVTPGSIIDKEAYNRATSVYLVDRTVPMLPERLCNEICSLRPDEDKLTHSCIVDLDDDANVVNVEICHTVTRSNRRFSYEEAQQIIESGEGEYKDELLTLNRLAKLMRQRRFDNGAISFERVEAGFLIDENGRPIEVVFKESKDANKLIEEFMLLANMKVAESIGKVPKGKKAKAMVYRIHDEPDLDKLTNLMEIAHRFGYRLKINSNKSRETNKSINAMLKSAAGKGEESMLSMLAVRSMAKAVYSAMNVGHYGLAVDYYTHFTSPIRRYPDMMVHRLLDRYKDGQRSVQQDVLEERCKHCSDMEQLATAAERSSIKFKQVEYLGERLGDVFTGTISGVTEWGFYVELDENRCEGLVPARDLEDDYYDFDEKNYCLRGRRTRKTYQLGDKVTVQIARADLIKKQLDFALVDDKHPAGTHHIDKEPITVSSERLKSMEQMRAAQKNRRRSGAKPGGKSGAKPTRSRKNEHKGKGHRQQKK